MVESCDTPETERREQPGNTKPEKTFRIGLLKETIWKNPTEKRHYYSVDLVCSYSDKHGAWQETASLGHDDLLNAATLAKRAEVWIAS